MCSGSSFFNGTAWRVKLPLKSSMLEPPEKVPLMAGMIALKGSLSYLLLDSPQHFLYFVNQPTARVSSEDRHRMARLLEGNVKKKFS
jgi:hypothetical protein